MSVVTASSPERTALSASSAAVSARPMAANSTMPAEPFSVWKARKALSSRSRSPGDCSSASRSATACSDEFAALDQELFDELVHADWPQNRAAYRASISWVIGLTR